MNLFRLGHVPWEESQLIYHAMAYEGVEGLILLSPASPYVCIGYHQDVNQEVDLAYCHAHDIPVFRREVGGGAVFLDGRQLFYQLILHRDHPLAAADKETFYRRLLEPVVQTYAELGIPARYKPVNDIITETGRKISGNGAAHIGDSVVLVGNLIFDFDYDTMVRVLRVPDEKYRDKVHKSLYENLTTMQREQAELSSEDEALAVLVRQFEAVLGPMETAEVPPAVWERAAQLQPRFMSEEWLQGRARRVGAGRNVKIAAGVHVIQRLHKTPGGLVRVTMDVKDDVIQSVSISGDFFFYPEQKLADLESALVGRALTELPAVIAAFYAEQQIDSPGLTPGLLGDILLGAA
jgi:lipoate---protein ligase